MVKEQIIKLSNVVIIIYIVKYQIFAILLRELSISIIYYLEKNKYQNIIY